MEKKFVQAGIRRGKILQMKMAKWYEGKPVVSIMVLVLLVLGCLFCNFFIPKDPTHMDLYHTNIAPNREFLFGTDAMGRDIFSMIFYGGRISLSIGFFSTVISTVVAILFGVVSGFSPKWIYDAWMRILEVLISIPNLLLIVLLQSILGQANVFTISVVIGMTGWMSIAKVVATEVRQLKSSGYVVAARCMGGGFFHILCKHLAPNLVASIMFMVVMNIRGAMSSEATLSFLGIGLSVEVISWGSMLSLAQRALLINSWWVIFFPGFFLIVTFVSITNIGNYMRKSMNQKESYL